MAAATATLKIEVKHHIDYHTSCSIHWKLNTWVNISVSQLLDCIEHKMAQNALFTTTDFPTVRTAFFNPFLSEPLSSTRMIPARIQAAK